MAARGTLDPPVAGRAPDVPAGPPRVPRAPVDRSRATGRATICRALAAVLGLLVAAGAAAPGDPAAAAGTSPVVVRYRPPVTVPVRLVRAFVAPAHPWSAGHRGIDLALVEGGTVVAPGDGSVVVAQRVVDRGVVTIAHPDGRRSSLEPVTATVVVGEAVAAGDPVGVLSVEHSHCPGCLHWGVREGTTYVDPLALLPGGGPIVLLP